MSRLTQAPSGVAFTGISSRAYSNLLLYLTEEGVGSLFRLGIRIYKNGAKQSASEAVFQMVND
jgi:hypothetical protein